jgi:xanthine dehydrogenase YagS FAD-binding subunit
MHGFVYEHAATLAQAASAAEARATMLIAGGTELLNWMKEGIVAPQRLVDINRVAGLSSIEADEHGLRAGALVRMSDLARHDIVRRDYLALSESLLKSASAQIRNMASIGGNLMQRTRCAYFRAETELPCNKRRPGSGCAALQGEDRFAAIFGWTERCIATHPSDLAVALAALDAVVHLHGPTGARTIPITDFYSAPDHEAALAVGEVITAVEVPGSALARRSHYLKVRERASYEFALVSAAVGLDTEGTSIRAARIALGGVAAKPWRLRQTEDALRGVSLTDDSALRRVVDAGLADARPRRHNGFKLELVRRVVVRALQTAGGLA